MLQISVGCHQYGKAVLLSRVKQFAILEFRPTAFERRGHFMPCQMLAQRDRRALIKEDTHSSRGQGAPRGVIENCAGLLEGHPGKPLYEVRHLGPILQILKQC